MDENQRRAFNDWINQCKVPIIDISDTNQQAIAALAHNPWQNADGTCKRWCGDGECKEGCAQPSAASPEYKAITGGQGKTTGYVMTNADKAPSYDQPAVMDSIRKRFESLIGPYHLSRNDAPDSDLDGYQDSHTQMAWKYYKKGLADQQVSTIDRAAIHRKVLASGIDGPDVVGPTVCTVPPPGWSCTRAPGHDGPCAAVQVQDEADLARKDADLYGVGFIINGLRVAPECVKVFKPSQASKGAAEVFKHKGGGMYEKLGTLSAKVGDIGWCQNCVRYRSLENGKEYVTDSKRWAAFFTTTNQDKENK